MKVTNLHKKTLAIWFLTISAMGIAFAQDYGITVFGTDLISKEKVRKYCSDELEILKKFYDSNRDKYQIKKTALENKLITFGDFTYVNIHLFKSYTNDYDFIIDYVETREAKTRLNYRKIETKYFDDPDGLIAKWQEYEDVSYQLFKDGEIIDYNCPVIHCLWSFNHPKLKPYLEFINTYAPKHKDTLIKILNTSDLPEQRASAAFLLAHTEINNVDLLQTLMPSIYDSDSNVRNNSMRVIYYIARAFPEMRFNTSKIIGALDFPSFTDRNKALVILRSIPLNNLNKGDSKRLSDILIEILEKKDAHNYKNAHRVIKKLTQKDYDIDDIEQWRKWNNSSQILYSKKNNNSVGWSIHSINPDGSDDRIIIPFKSGMGEYNPSISSNGKSIIFNTYRYGGWKLATYDISSKKITRITKASNYFTNANYSPNGNQIVYEKSIGKSTHICLANSNGSNEIILTSESHSSENRIPQWTPNGKSIIFYSDKNKVNDIYIMNIESRSLKNLTNNKSGNDFAPSISPNGKQIAFFSDRNGYLDLYTMDISGGTPTLLTKTIQNENNKYNYYTDSNTYWIFKNSWSPDGNYLVFSNATNDNIDLFTINKNGSDLKNITNSPQSEHTPVWSLIDY